MVKLAKPLGDEAEAKVKAGVLPRLLTPKEVDAAALEAGLVQCDCTAEVSEGGGNV